MSADRTAADWYIRPLPHRGTRGQLDESLVAACGLACAAAAIHLAAALDHFREHSYHAVFLALAGCAQLAWAFALYRAPSPRLLVGGTLGALALVALWIVSRTSGMPIGPSRAVEPIGVLDSVASVDQLLVAVLLTLRLGSAPSRRVAGLLNTAALFLLLLSCVAVTHAGYVH